MYSTAGCMCVSTRACLACFSTQKVRANMHAACVCAAYLTNPHSAMTLSLMFPLNHTEEPNPEAYGNYTHLHLSAHTYCTHTLSHCLCSHRFTEGVRKLQFGESARAFLASFYNTSSPMVGMTICLRVVSFVGVSACAGSRTCRGAPRHPVMCDFFPSVCLCLFKQGERLLMEELCEM